MDELDKLKEVGAPKLAKAKEEQNEKIDACIMLLGALCDSNDAILEAKIAQHAAWIKATDKRFYASLIAIALTGAVLYLDVLKLDENSVIVASVINLLNAVKGLL